MTETTIPVVDQTTTQVSPDAIPVKPRRTAVIAKIREEASITKSEARIWLEWLLATINAMREAGETTHYLTAGEMERHHAILDTIAPDDTVAQPGSAHALVQDFVLDPSRGEVALTHSFGEDPNAESYCLFEVGVMTVTTG